MAAPQGNWYKNPVFSALQIGNFTRVWAPASHIICRWSLGAGRNKLVLFTKLARGNPAKQKNYTCQFD